MNNQLDFMVLWSPNGDAHRIEGSDSAHARAEADRLAALNPGTTFVVLRPAYSTSDVITIKAA